MKLRTDAAGKPRMMPENMRRVNGDIARGRKENAEIKRKYYAALLNVSRQTTPDLSTLTGHDKLSGADIDDMVPSLSEVQGAIGKLKTIGLRGLIK